MKVMKTIRRIDKWVHSDWMEENVWRSIVLIIMVYAVVRTLLDFMPRCIKTIVIAAILMTAATQVQAQTQIVYFASGNDLTATIDVHNITISQDGNYIICNGIRYPRSGSVVAGACRVTHWNPVYHTWDKFGSVTIKSGTQYLDGEIRVKSKPVKYIPDDKSYTSPDFRVMYFMVAQVTTGITTTIKNNVTIYEWDFGKGVWVPTSTIVSPWINGWIKISPFDGTDWSHFLNGRLDTDYVPPPGGLGGTTPPVMPAKVK